MLNILKKKRNKIVTVVASSLDAELEFSVDCWVKTRTVFDMVCRTIGLREASFFGLAYISKSGYPVWLKLDKKMIDQIPSDQIQDDTIHLQFYAKFYPENIEEELIQDVTRHLFFLQYQKLILAGMLSCQPEAALLLASFSLQAKFGDFDAVTSKHRAATDFYEQFLPKGFPIMDGVIGQINTWHAAHQGLYKEEAELEYLKIVHDFEMSGVNYFPIQDGNGVSKWLGVNARSVALYACDDKVHATMRIDWSSLADMCYNGSRFTMKQTPPAPLGLENLNRRVKLIGANRSPQKEGAPRGEDLVFMVDDQEVCKLILDLCRGNHDLFMDRRKVGSTMERQQMRNLALEEKARRQMERARLRKEQEQQVIAQREKEEVEEKFQQLELRYSDLFAALQRAEETSELLGEKVRAYEEEAELLRAKAVNRESEIQSLKNKLEMSQNSAHELENECNRWKEKLQQITEQSNEKFEEYEMMKEELAETKKLLMENHLVAHFSPAGNPAHEFWSGYPSSNQPPTSTPTTTQQYHQPSYNEPVEMVACTSSNQLDDVRHHNDENRQILSAQIQNEKYEYQTKSHKFQQQLQEIHSKIQTFKNTDASLVYENESIEAHSNNNSQENLFDSLHLPNNEV